ncbi:hypothetical protein AA313_de0210223 [Arthrobotrys entomopaga]|nr:hypothetical protein AA313_de0210223 [Arthrobotrys entomopaga]
MSCLIRKYLIDKRQRGQTSLPNFWRRFFAPFIYALLILLSAIRWASYKHPFHPSQPSTALTFPHNSQRILKIPASFSVSNIPIYSPSNTSYPHIQSSFKIMTMVLKRKRSEDAMSICSDSSRSSSTSPFSNNVMMVDTDAITQHHVPLGVHSRTLKRWRNLRPDEKSVHDYTMSKLFSAQRSSHQQAAPPNPISPSFTPVTHTQQSSQRNIMSFFNPTQSHQNIPSTNGLVSQRSIHAISCSDCERSMETPFDDEEGECYACRGCYKKVCGGCSTGGQEWGMERRCLECALR